MAFRNLPIAGTYLVRSAMQSPNFVSGSAGWSVFRDGSAEFNNVTIRGATVAQGVSLYYNGTPALGNMIVSIAPAAGTDVYGNAYPQGITTYDGAGHKTGTWNLGSLQTYDPVSTGSIGIFPQSTAGLSPTIQINTGGTSSTVPAQLSAFAVTTGANQPYDIGTFYGPESTADAHHSYAAVQLRAGGTATDGAVGTLGWGNNSTTYIPFIWNQAGIVGIGTVYGATPGTSPAAQETWHTLSLAASWTQHPFAQCRYRMMPDGTVMAQGFMDFAGTLTSGATISGTVLPAAYRPLQTYLVPVCFSGNVFGQLQINPAGSIQVFFPGASLVNPTLALDALRWPVI